MLIPIPSPAQRGRQLTRVLAPAAFVLLHGRIREGAFLNRESSSLHVKVMPDRQVQSFARNAISQYLGAPSCNDDAPVAEYVDLLVA